MDDTPYKPSIRTIPEERLGALRKAGIKCKIAWPEEITRHFGPDETINYLDLTKAQKTKLDAFIYSLASFKDFTLTSGVWGGSPVLRTELGKASNYATLVADYHNDPRGSTQLNSYGQSVSGTDPNGDHWTISILDSRGSSMFIPRFHVYLPDTTYAPLELFPDEERFLRQALFELEPSSKVEVGTRGVHFKGAEVQAFQHKILSNQGYAKTLRQRAAKKEAQREKEVQKKEEQDSQAFGDYSGKGGSYSTSGWDSGSTGSFGPPRPPGLTTSKDSTSKDKEDDDSWGESAEPTDSVGSTTATSTTTMSSTTQSGPTTGTPPKDSWED